MTFPSRSPLSHYFHGTELQGCGSPHTPHNYVWSLAHCTQGLTTTDPGERAELFRYVCMGN